MFLAVYVHRRLGLTVDLTDDPSSIPASAVHEGPAFSRLTAIPDNLRSPAGLSNWLAGFLPENGGIAPYQSAATKAWQAHDGNVSRISRAAILWGNTDAEFTGAVDFRRCDGHQAPSSLPDYQTAKVEPLTEQDIGRRIRLATDIAEETPYVRPWEPLELAGRRSSLSGMRGKLGISSLPGDRWGIASADGLNTWICKHEQRLNLPGEAGLEAICLRTLRLAGIPSARTTTRIFDGCQAVLSQRTDRVTSPSGIVSARHQEEWVQAVCEPPHMKYGHQLLPDAGWPQPYLLLDRLSTRPSDSHATLHRIVAAAWLLGNGDLHRRNLGFLHAPRSEPHSLDIAPVYDFSSSAGTRYSPHPSIPIHQARRSPRATPVQWLKHCSQCRIPADIVIATIDDLIRTLPDALSTAREQARTEDQNISHDRVSRRVDDAILHVRSRARQWRDQIRGTARRNTSPVFKASVRQAADTLRTARSSHPGGTIAYTAAPGSRKLRMTYRTDDGGESISLGVPGDAREAALIEVLAGTSPPHRIPELEQSLEAERQRQLAPGRDRG